MVEFDKGNLEDFASGDINEYFESKKEYLDYILDGESLYKESLGWFDTLKWASDDWLDRITAIVDDIRGIADTFVLIGVGGSDNASRSVIEALDLNDDIKVIYADNTLSPYTSKKMLPH